jgi:leucyl aminopeptidase
MVEFIDVTDQDAIFSEADWDALLVVSADVTACPIEEVAMLASHGAQVDKRVGKSPTLLFAPGLAGGRLIIAPVAPLGDYDDVRAFANAARAGIAIARDAGAKRPLLWVDKPTSLGDEYAKADMVAALAMAQELWQPLEAREAGTALDSIEAIGVLNGADADMLNAIEAGRNLARDLCGTEPERMGAPAFADYCLNAFKESGLSLQVVEDRDILERDYPLLSAVARASFAVARHQPRVVKLEYRGEGDIQHNYFFAGKGVVYDTGGADLKVAGAMAGMSRDKGGAAAVAGLMKTLSLLKPKGIRVVAELGLVRNSIGSEAFVTDEIITAHSGVRVRIGNTDAEGRLVLADLLSHLRLKAQGSAAPELFSVATLTGHVVRAYGSYSAVVANAVAEQQALPKRLQASAERYGEGLELSRLRKEDFAKVRDVSGASELLSSNNAPSSVTARGHQYPAAFLLKASGLAQHGLKDVQPMAYSHLDIAGSATEGDPLYGKPTAEPLLGLFAYMTE